jgi:hypothetical protein
MHKSIPLLATCAMLALATPAAATEWIICSNADNTASIGVLAGGVDFNNFSRANLTVGEESWSTDPSLEPGRPARIAQSFWNGTELFVDISDDEAINIIGELRVFTLSNEWGEAKGGVLRVIGEGVFAVTCEGP